MDADGRLLRILCLHGYRQNADFFREKTGSLRKIVKKYSELIYVSAPNAVPPLNSDDGKDSESGDKRGWWFSAEDNSYIPDEPTECCKGYQESLDVIVKTFQEQGPFDGVLGFSQGASMVSLLCGLQEKDNYSGLIRFNFAIIIAGFKSRSSPHDHLYEKKVKIPSLHVYGATDAVIGEEMSKELLDYFECPQTLEHEGGHFVPTSGDRKRIYTEFLSREHKKRFSSS